MASRISFDQEEVRRDMVGTREATTKARAVSMLAVLASSVVLVLVSPTFAQKSVGYKILILYFEPEGTLGSNGEQVTVTAIEGVCFEPSVTIRVSVTQEATGAAARGTFEGSCTGAPMNVPIAATVRQGVPAFEEGSALVCGSTVTRRNTDGPITDSDAWCRFITLVRAAG
ncbi:MAG: hypothetical protein ACRELA_06500 [Candidatus Rokuibacteriota bacterium]